MPSMLNRWATGLRDFFSLFRDPCFLGLLVFTLSVAGILIQDEVSHLVNGMVAATTTAVARPSGKLILPKISRIIIYPADKYRFVAEEQQEFKVYSFSDCAVYWFKDAKLDEPIHAEGHFDATGVHLKVHLHNAQEMEFR